MDVTFGGGSVDEHAVRHCRARHLAEPVVTQAKLFGQLVNCGELFRGKRLHYFSDVTGVYIMTALQQVIFIRASEAIVLCGMRRRWTRFVIAKLNTDRIERV